MKTCFQGAKRGITPLHILPYPLCGSEGKNQSFWLFFCAFCCVLGDFSRAGRRLKRIYVPVENRGPLLCASPILRAGQGLRERCRPPLGRAGHRTGRAGGPGEGNGRERAACGPPASDRQSESQRHSGAGSVMPLQGLVMPPLLGVVMTVAPDRLRLLKQKNALQNLLRQAFFGSTGTFLSE